METAVSPQIESAKAYSLLNSWREHPQIYMRDVLQVEKIWKLQDELLSALPRAMKERKHIYIGSGHSLGKDYMCAGIALWFLDCFKPSIVVETAPTDRQVKKIMWGETLGHWHRRDPAFGGTAYRQPYIEIRPEDWYLLGFTTKETGASKEAEGGKFQGFHAPNVCVIVSEAQAVEDTIYDQIDGITTSENTLVIFIGNPTRATGRFAKGLRNKTDNIVFNFDCRDNPNYKHRKTIIPGLASYEWVEAMRTKWGEDDPRWDGRVRGQIPKKSINTLFPPEILEQMKRPVVSFKNNVGVSVDSAGEGIDDNVIMGGKNGNVSKMIVKRNQAPGLNAIDALNMADELNAAFIMVDCDGVGIGTWQEIMRREESKKYLVIKYHGSAKEKELDPKMRDRPQYENLRAKAHFEVAEAAKQGLASIPEDEELKDDLGEPQYFENNRGRVAIEDKDDIKDRLGRSPNRGDAWIMLQWGFLQNYEKPEIEREVGVDRQGQGIPITESGEIAPEPVATGY